MLLGGRGPLGSWRAYLLFPSIAIAKPYYPMGLV